MKTTLSFLVALLLSNFLTAQTTAIPDSNFEQALIDFGIDTGVPDGTVPTANLGSIGSLNVSNKNISDLTGIEDFTGLTVLSCWDNQLTSLDISQNTTLIELWCPKNQLTILDVTQNTSLTKIICSENFISTLDVTQNLALNYLDCNKNQISHLNVNVNTALTVLSFSYNQLTSIDVTQNAALITLNGDKNQLTSLDIAQNTLLTSIDCGYNQLTSLDVTQNTLLDFLICSSNQLTTIDLSQNNILTALYCGFQQIGTLDVTQNPDLTFLLCRNNQITNLNLTLNPNLIHLRCSNNPLNGLSINQQSALELIECHNNQLTSLDISNNLSLSYLLCNDNLLTSIDASQNSNLVGLLANNNSLTCLNVRNNNNNINFTNFEVNGNPSLSCIEVDDSAWAAINWLNIDTTSSFSNNCNNSCNSAPCNTSVNFNWMDNISGNYSFTNSSSGNFTQSHWAFGDGSTSTSTNSNHTFTANGTFIVILTINDSTNGCYDYSMDTIVVSGVITPVQCAAGFVIYPDTVMGDITVVNSSTGTNLTYLWGFGDGNSSTLQNPNHTYTTTGPFQLCLTIDDGAGCIDIYCDSIGENGVVFKTGGFTINVVGTTIATGIDNHPKLNSDINIYPNPASNQLTVDTGLKLSEITIIDITGKIIMTIKQNTNIINVADLSDGIYFIQLITMEGTITKKFVKQ